MTTSSSISVALADDHRLFRDGIKRILTERKDITVVWEAGDGQELLAKLRQLQPDVLLLDLRMPLADGLSMLPLIHKDYEAVKVIVLSMDTTPEMIARMMKLGAHSYLSKNTEPAELYTAIVACFTQGCYFTGQMNQVLLHQLQEDRKDRQDPLVTLSEKERYVLQALALEKKTEDIARESSLNPRTIEAIRQRLKTKTGTQTTVGLVLYALRHKLLP